MTEEILNKKVSETINALTLKLKRIALTEEELLLLMYKYENIYQIVLSEFCNEKKARLLIREIKEIKKYHLINMIIVLNTKRINLLLQKR